MAQLSSSLFSMLLNDKLLSFANVLLSKWRDCHKAFNFCKTQKRKVQPKAKNNLQMKNAYFKLMKSQCTFHRFAMELLSKPKILKGKFGKRRNKLGLSLAKLSYLVFKFGVCLVFADKDRLSLSCQKIIVEVSSK